jgi:hypothetical protein
MSRCASTHARPRNPSPASRDSRPPNRCSTERQVTSEPVELALIPVNDLLEPKPYESRRVPRASMPPFRPARRRGARSNRGRSGSGSLADAAAAGRARVGQVSPLPANGASSVCQRYGASRGPGTHVATVLAPGPVVLASLKRLGQLADSHCVTCLDTTFTACKSGKATWPHEEGEK